MTLVLPGMVIVPSTWFCFVCNRNGDPNDEMTTFADLFNSQINPSDRQFADILSQMLDRPLNPDSVHSRTVCEDCQNLCTEFDELVMRMNAIKLHVTQSMLDTIDHYGDDKKFQQTGDSQLFSITPDIGTDDPFPGFEADEIDDNPDESADSKLHLNQTSVIKLEVNEIDSVNVKKRGRPRKLDKNNELAGKNKVEVGYSPVIQNDVAAKKQRGRPKKQVQLSPVKVTSKNIASEVSTRKTTQKDSLQTSSKEEAPETILETNKNKNSVKEESTIKSEPEEHLEDDDDDGLNDFIADVIGTYDENHSTKSEDMEVDEVKNTMVGTSPSKIVDEATSKPLFLRDAHKFHCQLCQLSPIQDFTHKTIATHLKTEHGECIKVCDVCGSDFREKAELTVHMKQHIKYNTKLECPVCQKLFTTLRLFRSHRKTHKENPTRAIWQCKFCNKMFHSQNTLEEHKNTHSGDRPYKCSECPKDFASKYCLNAHLNTHLDRTRSYTCTICSKMFYTQQHLIKHEQTHTTVKRFKCQDCNKAFSTQYNLDSHRIVHTGEKKYLCGTCGKSFARANEIRDHERSHTGEKPYKCDLCPASFSQQPNLIMHKRGKHFNDKRYKCGECGKLFARRRLLDYHMNANHTGLRPHVCATCGAGFVNPEHLKKHIRRTHTAAQPFQCEVCGKAFNSGENRAAHRFIHSEKKPYECVSCGQGFMRKPQLLAHMKSAKHEGTQIVLNQLRVPSGPIYGKTETGLNLTAFEEIRKVVSIDETAPQVSCKPEVQMTEDEFASQILMSTEGGDGDQSEMIETNDGRVHMMQIRMPKTNDVDWVKIVIDV